MNNINKLFSMSSGSSKFEEPFNTTYANPGAGVSVSNFYRNWNWYANGSNSLINPTDGLKVYGNSVEFARLTRAGGYSPNRDFDMSYKVRVGSSNSNAWCNVSIGGEPDFTGNSYTSIMKGLNFHFFSNYYYESLQIHQNGSLLATPYDASLSMNDGYHYIFIKKRGNSIGITAQTSPTAPITPAFTYTITDFTQVSSQLIIQVGVQQFELNQEDIEFGDFKITLY